MSTNLDFYLVSRELHQTVTLELDDELELTDQITGEIWRQHGEILRRGLHGFRTIVKGFVQSPSGVLTINLIVRPLAAD